MAEKRLRPDDDDVVLQKPEDGRVLIPVFHTTSACPGAATAYPASAHAPSSCVNLSGWPLRPCENTISGNGPLPEGR